MGNSSSSQYDVWTLIPSVHPSLACPLAVPSRCLTISNIFLQPQDCESQQSHSLPKSSTRGLRNNDQRSPYAQAISNNFPHPQDYESQESSRSLPKSRTRDVRNSEQRSPYIQHPNMGYRPQNQYGGHQQHGYNQQTYSNAQYSGNQTRDDRDDSSCCC